SNGDRNATLTLQDDASPGMQTDPLHGTGTSPPTTTTTTIITTTTTTTPPQPTCGGRLAVSPTVAEPGSVVTVRGAGWPAGQSVTVEWNRGIRDTQVVPGGGSFQVQLLVFRHD